MIVMLVGMLCGAFAEGQEIVGERPYEMEWAHRTEDDHPPLIDFENLDGWTVETDDAEAVFERSREQQIWGRYVGKLTYRGTGNQPRIVLRPAQPLQIAEPFDAVTCWVYGNNWAFAPDVTTPPVVVSAVFLDSAGQEFGVVLEQVGWQEWFLCHRRLTPEQIAGVADGASFSGISVSGGRNEDDRVICLDNLAVFTEELAPLSFKPRPERGIAMFPGQGTGTNTGPGRLPFPTRPETILPDNAVPDYRTMVREKDGAFQFVYAGTDGRFAHELRPETGTFSDIEWTREEPKTLIQPCVGGGVYFHTEGEPTPPDHVEHLGTELVPDPDFETEHTPEGANKVVSRWRMHLGDRSAEVTYTYRMWGKSLVIDVVAPGGEIGEVRYGRAVGVDNPRLVTLPFYPAGAGSSRPAVLVAGSEEDALFLMGNTCWYLSNASMPFAINEIKDGEAVYNGGTRYIPRTDGQRNDCYERLFVTIAPRLEEVLPTIPNPESPWKHITGTHVWRAHGASDRERDLAHWRECHRYGMTEVVITDHETGWRDGGESFTFRTRTAPGKGGDESQYAYARALQDELGFVYGPYNNYTDFAPVNEYWHTDRMSRLPDNQLQRAWPRCYAPKPAVAVELCELLAPQIEAKFGFSTAYCDVHTAVAPWDRVDYDRRVPGAATFGAVFYSYGEIMLLQKAAWDGPVYSEGNNHAFYCGLTDGNYGQDQRYGLSANPWLVDFDLRKMHDLCCNFGMGNPEMFYGGGYSLGANEQEVDASIDRFLAATLAFGHPGFLVYEGGGLRTALRSYYMLQQLHSLYCLSSADEIRYAGPQGNLLDTTAAVATGTFERSQVVCRYANGCVTVANGHPTERMVVEAFGRRIDLPPNGYAGWAADGSVEVFSGEREGHRNDYAATPAYTFVDGREQFTRFERAAGNRIGICRHLAEGKHEIILFKGAEAGFAIGGATAVALDQDEKELGPAEVRIARGLTYVMPVEGAFSYLLSPAPAPVIELTCDRDTVVAGETVVIRGEQGHEVQIPASAQEGDRLWFEFEGAWIDFTVKALAAIELSLDRGDLVARLTSNLAEHVDAEVRLDGKRQPVRLVPGEPMLVTMDLGEADREAIEVLRLEVRAGELSHTVERVLRTVRGFAAAAAMPEKYQAGMRLRGGEETYDFGQTRGGVYQAQATCGGESKTGCAGHPPWWGAVGYSFALYDPIDLPGQPAAFRAWVGKMDGSDPGDGVLYRLAVVDADGHETIAGESLVTQHEWRELQADLTPWAGQRVQLKMIADVGEDDNSIGDWACWADMRLETLAEVLIRSLEDDLERYRLEAPPLPVEGLTVADLRQARSGRILHDGVGLEGAGEYGTEAVLNGVELGPMARAAGSETEGVWAEGVEVLLTPESIQTLGVRNVFAIRNPRQDWFKVRRFWIELELADGRHCSSQISAASFTQPPNWPYAEGIGVPHGEDITVEIWFSAEE